jgi:hypothetical protein
MKNCRLRKNTAAIEQKIIDDRGYLEKLMNASACQFAVDTNNTEARGEFTAYKRAIGMLDDIQRQFIFTNYANSGCDMEENHDGE